MGRIVTTVLPNLVPQRRIDDCYENFVIRCYQVTEIFRSGHDCTSTSSARRNCYFRHQADIAVWVFREVRVDTVLARAWFHFCSRLHW